MPRDPLDTLVNLRRAGEDGAKLALARATTAESDAAAAGMAADRAIVDEQRAALDLAGDDGVVEAFAAWLPAARDRAARAWQACERARTEVARARALLAAAQAATETVETLRRRRAEAKRDARDRRMQADLDGMARPSGEFGFGSE